jgi:multicomponent Na+:H+ antiporter subunit C
LLHNYHYAATVVLFCIGLYNVIMQRNMIKKLIGLNIMETSVFFFYICIGYMANGIAPLLAEGADPGRMVNPIPQVFVLTGIVVAVGVTALALSLAILLYRKYGTLEVDRLLSEDTQAEREEGTAD